MKNAGRTGLLCAVMVVLAAGTVAAFPVAVKDDRQKAVALAECPQRIVSLAPTNTELLYALGLESRIVAVTRYCDHPEAAREKEKVGGFADIDVERIIALKPDVVLAFGTVQLPAVDALEAKGLKVFWTYPRTVDDILALFERVGKLTGAAAKARDLRDSVGAEIRSLRRAYGALPESDRPTVFRVMNFNRPGTVGADSFQSALFSIAGGRNAFPLPGEDYVEVDQRDLMKRDPKVIVVCGDDEEKEKQRLKDSPVYRDLLAVRTGSVLVLPCELICRPGPRIGETARRLSQFLHPEIK